jgi:hypothetical protein
MMECTSLLLLYRSSQTATSSGATRLRALSLSAHCAAPQASQQPAAGGAPLAEIDVSLVFVDAQHHDGLDAPNLAARSEKQG